jgi:hypothetical protein
MTDLDEAIGIMERIALLDAETAGLEFHRDGARILAASCEVETLRKQLPQAAPEQLEMHGLYLGHEDFTAVWTVGQVPPVLFAQRALDYLAREATQEFGRDANWRGMTAFFGPAVVTPMFAILRGTMAGISVQHRRLEAEQVDLGGDDRGKIYAAIGSDDPAFEEAYVQPCSADDEHASVITIADLDGPWDELRDLLTERDRVARRALRGESA